MKRPQRELLIGVWVDFGRMLARKPVAGVLGSTVLYFANVRLSVRLSVRNHVKLPNQTQMYDNHVDTMSKLT